MVRRHAVLQRAKKKLREIAVFLRLYRAKKGRRTLKRAVTAQRLLRRASTGSFKLPQALTQPAGT